MQRTSIIRLLEGALVITGAISSVAAQAVPKPDLGFKGPVKTVQVPNRTAISLASELKGAALQTAPSSIQLGQSLSHKSMTPAAQSVSLGGDVTKTSPPRRTDETIIVRSLMDGSGDSEKDAPCPRVPREGFKEIGPDGCPRLFLARKRGIS